MKYKLGAVYPKDGWDYFMTVRATPSWYNFCDCTYTRYYGSGSQWWEAGSDRRVDSWMSAVLHGFWNDEMNKLTERQKH